MSAARQVLGERGERVAERWLEGRGWHVIDRRYRSGHRDIDLVVERVSDEGRVVVFVEVKTRVSDGYGGPAAAVNWRKQREMARAARAWMERFRRPGDTFRFDVMAVVWRSCAEPEIIHLENAFSVG